MRGVRRSDDAAYTAWLERNTYTTTLVYSAFIGVLLPAFHYILGIAAHVPDSMPLRLLCTACTFVVAATLLCVPRMRRHAGVLQFIQVMLTVAVIDVLVVDSNDQYLYIASSLLVIIGVQNAVFRTSTLAVVMSFGFVFFGFYSALHGILLQPYNVTTLAILFAAYALAFIPATMHIQSRESDIRSRLAALRATSELEEAHAITHLGKWSQNASTGETECSAELLRILGLPLDTAQSAIMHLYVRSIHQEDREMVDSAFASCETVGHFSVDHRIVLPSGEIRWVALSGKQESRDGEAGHCIGTVIDITARKEAEVSLERLARYDPLTGLPNRSMLQEQLRDAIWQRRRDGGACAVLFLDLDRFKDINDTLGHSVGDLLLKEVSTRIGSLLPGGTLVTRWGGDEFVALLPHADGGEEVELICRRVVHGLSTPFTIDSYEFAVAASIGVALFPQDGTDPEVLIRNADTAMYAAKETAAQRYAFFAPEMHAIASMRHHIQNQLQNAIATGSLSLHYQPIIDTASGQVVAAEALLRWTDAEGRLRPPAEFISIAEDTGAIVPIGMWVMQQGARQAIAWGRTGMPLTVSINVSPRQLAHPEFSDMLAQVLRETGVDPALLEVEITESGLVSDVRATMRVLENIRSMGVRIAVDDFGTGYSAFSYLKQLPLTTLKIDRTFVDGIERDVDRAIAQSIIDIAHKLDLSVTAEGVETRFQRKILGELGCDRLQGFDICKPLPIEGFQDFARQRLAAS